MKKKLTGRDVADLVGAGEVYRKAEVNRLFNESAEPDSTVVSDEAYEEAMRIMEGVEKAQDTVE